MNRPAFALVLAVLLIGSILVVPTTGSDTQPGGPPPDADGDVTIRLGGSSRASPDTGMLVNWGVSYEAPSAEAAERAANGSLDVEWFDGDEALRAMAANYPGSEVEVEAVRTRHESGESPHGTIRVYTSLEVEELFANDREQIVIGPTMAEYLSSGYYVKLYRPEHWEPVEASVPGDSDRGRAIHRWVVGEDPEPRIVLNESDADEPNWPLGTGPVVAVVALALVAVALAARRRS